MRIEWERLSGGTEAQVRRVMLFDKRGEVSGILNVSVPGKHEVWAELSAEAKYQEGQRDRVAAEIVEALEAQEKKL